MSSGGQIEARDAKRDASHTLKMAC